MAIRKVGNIYDGKSGLRKVGNIYDSSGDEKKKRLEEAQARAEAARIEAERLNSFSGLAGETAKGVFGIGKELGKDIVGTTAAIGADVANVLTPWKKRTESVNLFGNEYVTPSTRGVRSGTLAREGKHKQSLGELGTAGLDIATTFLTPFKGAQVLKGGAFTRGFIQGGTAAAPITAGYGLAGSAIEDKGGIEMAKDTAIAGAAGFAGGGILGGALSKVGSRVAGNPIKDVGDFEVGRIIDDVDKEIGRATTPKEEEEIINLVSRGATRDEIITEVGKAKISEGLNPKVRLSQVVDEIESGGKKLSLEEVATVKKGMEEGKSLEEIQTSLEPQKETSTETPDNGDEAFLKSVEERFLASKREKFREATKDKQGRFTGSKSEARMAIGDPERDALSESIQKRLDLLGKDDLNKATQENFYDTSQSLRLEDIQNQIPKAKAEELPRLKQEADDIIQEILDKRAGEFKAASKREDRVRKAMTIANNSNTPLEFRINLRKEGMDKSFKSQQAAEEFYRRTRGGKYRLADQSDSEQSLLEEARKYKSAEEFVNGNLKVDTLLPSDRPMGEKTLADLKYTGSKANTQKVKVSSIEDVITKAKSVSDSGGDGSVGNYEVYDVLKRVKNGRIKVYHGTSETGANAIGGGWAGLKDGSYLSLTKGADKEAIGVYGAKYYADIADKYGKNGKVLEFEIPLKNIAIDETTGELRYVSDKTKSQLTDIWNKAHGEKFRDIAPRFEELTGTKITPEQEAQIKSLHKRMFGDENVEITAQILTPEGQKAFGVYQNKVIKILDGQVDPTDTFYHEAVHKYLDLFTTLDEQKSIYLEARKLWKTDNLDDLEEKIAENFIRYAKTNEGVVGTMKVLFDKVVDRIKSALKGESSIEALYKDILEGKAAKIEKAAPVKKIVPEGKKVSIIAERLNKDLPDDFKIDEMYNPKAINKEADKAAELIAKNKTKAIQKALDTGTNPMERDAILIELSEIAKRDKDYGTLSDIFNKRSELIRSGAQSLNMEKASILLNPQEKYMRDVVNARLGKVKISGKELTLEEVAKKRTGIRKEVNDAVRKSFKIEDAQDLFDKLLCT